MLDFGPKCTIFVQTKAIQVEVSKYTTETINPADISDLH